MRKPTLTRRQFVSSLASVGAAVTIVPRYAVARSGQTPPNEKLNIAAIGVGGMGRGDVNAVKSENIVALCDVDTRRSGDTLKTFPDAKVYRDFRKMFDEMENKIDAVTVSTPDHTHAVAAMAAITRGKHVYCQKPLAHSVYEVRQLMKAAQEHGVVTQLGNQGHSFDSIRTFCEWIWDGAIGKVHTIHAGCKAVNSALGALPRLKEKHDVPPELDWDLWLGPALERPYHPAYLPGAWRGWVPFGNGTVGDWTCHVVDPVFWALDLGSPTTIRAEVKDYDPKTQGDAFPTGEIITYEFPAKSLSQNRRGLAQSLFQKGTGSEPNQVFSPKNSDMARCLSPFGTGSHFAESSEQNVPVPLSSRGFGIGSNSDRGPVTMHWYSGTEPIPRPADLEEQRKPVETGAIVLGDRGTIMYGSHGAGGVRIIPEEKMRAYQQPEKTLPRGLEHHRDWIDAIRNGTKAGSDFATYGGPLTELAMLGVIAIKLPGVKLQWDTANMRFTNCDEANQLVNPPYREGWKL